MPIYGLRVLDEDVDFHAPVFQDVTLVSKEALKCHLENCSESDRTLIEANAAILGFEDINSLVGIRRLQTEPHNNDSWKTSITPLQDAFSVFTLWSLNRSNLRFGCGPFHEVGQRINFNFGINETLTDASGSGRWHQPVAFVPNAASSKRVQIKSELLNGSLKSLCEIVLLKKDDIHPSLFDALRLASRRLAVSSYVSDRLGELVAGLWTTLEILLSTGHPTDENIVGMAPVVLTSFSKTDIRNICKLRNAWVHRGTEPSEEDALMALRIGIYAIGTFADLVCAAPPKTPHSHLIQWLELSSFVTKQQPAGALAALHKHFKGRDPLQ